LFGPVLGAVVFTVLDEVLIEFGQLRVVAYGSLIIVLFLWIPRGVIPTVGAFWQRLAGRRDAASTDTTSDPVPDTSV
jgi:ABC-type branched-subunit amino acid transport system permease subunit